MLSYLKATTLEKLYTVKVTQPVSSVYEELAQASAGARPFSVRLSGLWVPRSGQCLDIAAKRRGRISLLILPSFLPTFLHSLLLHFETVSSCTVSSNIAFSNAAHPARHVTSMSGKASARSSLLTDCDRPLDRVHKEARIRQPENAHNGIWLPCAHDREDDHNLSARRIWRLLSRSSMSHVWRGVRRC